MDVSQSGSTNQIQSTPMHGGTENRNEASRLASTFCWSTSCKLTWWAGNNSRKFSFTEAHVVHYGLDRAQTALLASGIFMRGLVTSPLLVSTTGSVQDSNR